MAETVRKAGRRRRLQRSQCLPGRENLTDDNTQKVELPECRGWPEFRWVVATPSANRAAIYSIFKVHLVLRFAECVPEMMKREHCFALRFPQSHSAAERRTHEQDIQRRPTL